MLKFFPAKRYREHLSILVMRDNGPRRSYKIRLSHFVALMIFFLVMPFVCAFLLWKCLYFWERTRALEESVQLFETSAQLAEARAEKLQTLQDLLDETALPARNLILQKLAGASKPEHIQTDENREATLQEGPGHEEFGVIDNGEVKVDNVQIRRTGGNSLRIGLDLRNPDNEKILSGKITATLVTAGGEDYPLVFSPADAGSFRIKRFKRATMISRPGQHINVADGRVIIEVKDSANTVIYRNIYAIQY